MKLPEPAPNMFAVLQKDAQSFLNWLNNADAKALVAKANDHYVYWDKFKYWPMPVGIDTQTAWAAVKFARSHPNAVDDFKSKNGQPFWYWMPDGILQSLHTIDQNAAGQILLDDAQVPSSAKNQYIVNSLMEEAIASSQLEGAATTRESAKKMLRNRRTPQTKAEHMILNNYLAIQEIRTMKDEPMTIERIHNLHRILTENTLDDPTAAGRFRTEKEDVHVVDPTDGAVLHQPPNAKLLEGRMQKLCDFANESIEKSKFIHPVVRAIILHFWLAYEHPYVDGNGRTARTLFYWFMLRSQYWLFEFVSISRIILKSPARYARAFLYSELDDNDLTYFIQFNLKVIVIALSELRKYLRERQTRLRESLELLKQYKGINLRQHDVLEKAIRDPHASFTLAGHAIQFDVVYQTARLDLFNLEKRGLLKKLKAGRQFIFTPSEKLLGKIRT